MSKSRQWIENKLHTTPHAIAAQRGEDPSNFAKKVKRGLPAETVIEIAAMLNADPVQALRDTGYLPQEPHTETPEQLAERIKADVDRLASKLHESNVIPLRPNQDSDVHQAPYSDEQLGSVAYGEQDIDPKEDDDHIP